MSDLYIRKTLIDWKKVDRDSYLFQIPSLRSIEELTFHKNITLFAGENGTGKSTLLEGIAKAAGFNGEGGTRNYVFSTYDDVSELSSALSLIKGTRTMKGGYFFRAETFFNVATVTALNYNDDGMLPDYHARSHGESFLTFMERANKDGLYLMDEPEAALSPQRQLTLFIHISQLAAQGAQFIIATHSPILLGIPEAEIYQFDEDGIKPCSYEETESYQITKLFVENREMMVEKLLRDEE